MIKFNPTLISEQIASQINLFETRVTMATNAVQQLKHRRLAVDLLDTHQLDEMHLAISKVATDRGYKLMTERTSNYFQIEASKHKKRGGHFNYATCTMHYSRSTFNHIPIYHYRFQYQEYYPQIPQQY